MYELDEKDKLLLELLQKNGRESLTIIARKLNLSIDSTHKRIKKLQNAGIIDNFGVFINPRPLGYDLIANVQIKLTNISEEQLNKFISFLKNHKNVITLVSIIGDYDITCVIIAKDANELEQISRYIRQKYSALIADWRSVINLKIHKLEEYSF